MTDVMVGGVPEEDMAWTFTAYANYFEDLAGVIGRHGIGSTSLVAGVHAAVLEHGPNSTCNKRQLSLPEWEQLERSFRRCWGALRRAAREVERRYLFDGESNAWVPVMAYYAVYHGIVSAALAIGQRLADNHRSALKAASGWVTSGLLPYPWSAACTGCPQIGSHAWSGVETDHAAHVYTHHAPDRATSDMRLKQLLKTTREKALEATFQEERRRKVGRGRTRRNVSRARKQQLGEQIDATTLFDVFWRLRKRVNYDDADDLVFGAMDDTDAFRLANGLVTVADATVAALEGLVAARVDRDRVARMIDDYDELTGRSGRMFSEHVGSLCTLGNYPF